MALNERIEEIHRLIQSVRKVTVAELAERFNASKVTIRKDLESLEKQGVLQRTHGGAVLAEDRLRTIHIAHKVSQNVEAKARIAQRAADLIGEARTILLDSGSTTLAIARLLADSPARIITNSLPIADELASRPSGDFMLLGGDWRQESSSFIGPYALEILDGINADLAFIGASGFDPEHAFTCQNSIESHVKTRMLSRARHTYVVADSSKWQTVAFSTFAKTADVEALITDDDIPPEARRAMEAAGTYVLTPSDAVAESAVSG